MNSNFEIELIFFLLPPPRRHSGQRRINTRETTTDQDLERLHWP